MYFGLVDNPPTGYKSSGVNGVTNATNAFNSAGTDFSGDGVITSDTLIVLEGQDEGGHTIDTIPGVGSVTLADTLNGTETNLDFVAGNAELGLICGVSATGNLEMDATCTPAGGTAIKGVAHTRLTWPSQAIWKPFYLYAETEGRDLGDSFQGAYPCVTPVTIEVTIIPSTVTGGAGGITVSAHLHDGATNHHDIPDQVLTFTTSNTAVSGFGAVGTPTAAATTDENGMASVSNLVTGGVAADTDVIITVSSGGFAGTATLTITP